MKNHYQIIFMDPFSFSSISLMNSFIDSTVSENRSLFLLKTPDDVGLQVW